MISNCPYCQKNLNLNAAQQQKVQAALDKLQAGGSLKLGCPHCRKPIQIQADGQLAGGAAPEPKAQAAPGAAGQGPAPPPYPDISWLATGLYDEKTVVEDIPKVLVLMPEGPGREAVVNTFEGIGYHVDQAESSEDAISKMRFVTFEAVVFHTSIDGGLHKSPFHTSMCNMGMDKRRYIYYVLVGQSFHTLYDLEALAHSANMVVNDTEIANFDILLRKGLRDYDELFGPYIAALKEYGS